MPIPPLPSTHEPMTPSSTPNTHITSPAAPAHGNAPTTNTHHMVTRAKVGIAKPLARMNCHATTTSPIPRSYLHALRDPNWHKAMLDEYNALISNGTWALVPRPANGIDCDETFGPVVKPATIRTVLSLVVTRDCPIHQLDVKNAFLHGQLSEMVFMHQPPGFVDSSHHNYVCHLQRSFLNVQRKFLSAHCNPCKTHVDTESKLGSDADPVSDPTLYHSLAGALQYLTFTRSYISYVVQQICLYMHDPRDPYFSTLKRILRYVRGTINHGLQLHVSSTSQLTAYIDADWDGCPVTRRSTSGYCVFLGDNLLSWSAKRQVTLSRSSAEAEYRGVADVVAETAWLWNLLLELHDPLSTATLVNFDNVSVVYLSTNLVQHQRTKHIEIDIHFVREYVASGQVRVLHVPFRFQYADIFTKGLLTALFLEFRSSLNVRRPPAQTAEEC
uniref:Ribonuclease H-like domain-containing protein n=1 Tax=Tanacetum cinerariifolium TaxID=118510 RepID=A0A6L2JMR5_TANCI|nr:ribonuclease H-like domain-containing protein [Tanacetum cinerariifolium]